MKKMMHSLKYLLLKGRLSAKAGAAALSGLTLLGCWLYLSAGYRRNALAEISAHLLEINTYKAAQLHNWLDLQRREALWLSANRLLGKMVSDEAAKPGSRRAEIQSWFEAEQARNKFSSLALMNTGGAVIAATPGYRSGTEKVFTQVLLQAARGKPLLTDLYLTADGLPQMAMISPVAGRNSGGKPRFLLAALIDPATELYPLIKASPLFFVSAETLLVRQEGEDVLFLNELEYSRDSALKLKRRMDTKDLPAAAALRGVAGFFEGTDYRGVKVFSATDPFEGSNWAIVTKIDQDILLAPVKNKERLLLLELVLAAGALWGGFILIAARAERENEKRYRTLFDCMTSGLAHCRMIYEGDKPTDAEYLAVNPAFERLTGLKGAVGKRLTALIPGIRETNKELFEIYGRAARGGEPETFVTWVEGLKDWLSIAVYCPVYGEFVAIFEVITARKRLEEALAQKALELEKNNAELERFLYTVSHDLKSPVVTVKTFLSYLEQDLADTKPDRAAKDMLFISAAADKMAMMLDNLLEFSRIGRVVKPGARVTFRELAGEALAATAGRLSQCGARAQVAEAELTLFGDRLLLSEIWQNLVENACKFMGGQKEPRIELGIETRGGEPVFFVRDNGIGIEQHYLAKIFGLFERLDTRAEGTGIGLAIVKRTVELYKGRIWAESEGPGQGACFYFTLPGAGEKRP